MVKAAELREFDDDELDNRLSNARKELFNLRFQAATGRLDNSARLGILRRDIARMITVQRSREIDLAEAPALGGRPAARRRKDEEE